MAGNQMTRVSHLGFEPKQQKSFVAAQLVQSPHGLLQHMEARQIGALHQSEKGISAEMNRRIFRTEVFRFDLDMACASQERLRIVVIQLSKRLHDRQLGPTFPIGFYRILEHPIKRG